MALKYGAGRILSFEIKSKPKAALSKLTLFLRWDFRIFAKIQR